MKLNRISLFFLLAATSSVVYAEGENEMWLRGDQTGEDVELDGLDPEFDLFHDEYIGPATTRSGYNGQCDNPDLLAKKFAPYLNFDNGSQGYPMNAQYFYNYVLKNQDAPGSPGKKDGHVYLENQNKAMISTGKTPLYYQVERETKLDSLIITYYMAYGFQHECEICKILGGGGYHQGGFEQVSVVLTRGCSAVKGVIFKQHKGYYLKTGVNKRNGRPIVYVGSIQHGTYDDKACDASKYGDDVTYWADERCDDFEWDPQNDLYKLNFKDPPDFKGVSQSFLTSWNDSWSDYEDDAPGNHEKWGAQFLNKLGKVKEDSWMSKSACQGQMKFKTQGCKRASCNQGSAYTDHTKDNRFRCVEGCGSGWKAVSKDTCQNRNKKWKTKSRENYGKQQQSIKDFITSSLVEEE